MDSNIVNGNNIFDKMTQVIERQSNNSSSTTNINSNMVDAWVYAKYSNTKYYLTIFNNIFFTYFLHPMLVNVKSKKKNTEIVSNNQRMSKPQRPQTTETSS